MMAVAAVVFVGVFVVLAIALCVAASRTSRMEERWTEEVEEYDRFPYKKDGGLSDKR